MSTIRHKNSKAELVTRSYLHRKGLRFRLHSKGLPGRPDLVLPRYRVALFVHGCFWHRHPGCTYSYMPKSNEDFWRTKFMQNVERDLRRSGELRELGWRVLVIWECQVADTAAMENLFEEIVRNPAW